MKQSYKQFIWAGAGILALGVIITLCRAQDDGFSPLISLPDLKVYSVSAPASASRGSLISVSDVTTNVGNMNAAQSLTDMYICPSTNNVTPGYWVASHNTSGIAKGKSWPWMGNVTVPSTQPVGTNYYIVVANGDKLVNESNYANNTNWVMIIVN